MYKVLIVDDEIHVLKGLKSIIKWEEYGLEIAAEARDGAEALEYIKRNNVNIVLTDIKMPHMSGIELLQELRRMNADIKSIILSAYDDFSFAKEAVKLGVENYILKPVNKEELSSTLLTILEKIECELYNKIQQHNSMDIFKENILYRWVTNSISKKELCERAGVLGFDLDGNDYMAAIIRPLGGSEIEDRNLEGFAIANICREVLSGAFNSIVFNRMDTGTVVIFHGDHLEQSLDRIKELLGICGQAIGQYLKVEVFITSGSIEKGFEQLFNSYVNGMNLQNYSLVYPAGYIVDYQSMMEKMNERLDSIKFDFDIFNNLLMLKKREKCNQMIDDLFAETLAGGGMTSEIIQNMAVEMIYNISVTLKQSSRGRIDLKKYPGVQFTDLFAITSGQKLVQWLKDLTNKAVDALIDGEECISPLIRQILQFIGNNYASEVSLKTLAQTFNVNASYLGQMFKAETGELFTNYLNNIRIEKAKEMLINTNLKVAEIYERTGYLDQSHFFRIFKKLTGVSPEEYRHGIKT